jgi:hypothetical protein
VSWDGSLTDSLKGTFRQPRLDFKGVATAWLPLQEVVLSSEEARIVPGVPARLQVRQASMEIVVGQADLDLWLNSLGLPFHLHFEPRGLLVKGSVAGFAVGEVEVKLEIVRGWFVLKPSRAAVLGIPQYVSSLLRMYLPIPPLSSEAQLLGIEHETKKLRLRFGLDDFDEDLTPGLFGRLQTRLLPMMR